ncbi:MAG: hypothetical protein ACK53Y_15450 [bacterium]
MGSGEGQGRCRLNQETDGGHSGLRARPAPGGWARQCRSPGGLGGIVKKKSIWDGATHRSKSRRSQPSHRRGRDSFQGLVKNKQREEHRTGSSTPAVQRGSVPRRLFFADQQRIAIA